VPGHWEGDGTVTGESLPPIHFGDGPPWSEDEDLQSPIVVSSRHKKHKTSAGFGSGHSRGRGRDQDDGGRSSSLLSPDNFEQDRGFFAGSNGDGSERYYVNQGGEANGPGGEYVTYPPEQARHSGLAPAAVDRRDSHFAGTLLPSRSYINSTGQHDYQSDSDVSSTESSPGMVNHDESRYSRDYQFTIASPDEEMHGKAVALFDFHRENENELPLVEGQVIWVSYRHGQGWLVAEDPRTHESGLVPEEYVRLLRDIQGGLHSLTGQVEGMFGGDGGTPTQAEHGQSFHHMPSASNGSNGYQQPVVSTFSTSSQDILPYPQHLLGTQFGQAPPQVVHYHGQRGGSQANTPTLASSLEGALGGKAESHVNKPMGASANLAKAIGDEDDSPVSPDSMEDDSLGDEDEDEDEDD
jgi:SH3 domain